jgi:hypothetical protein
VDGGTEWQARSYSCEIRPGDSLSKCCFMFFKITEKILEAVVPAPAPVITEHEVEELGRGVALYDCTPPRVDVLGFKKGEIIVLLSQSSEDWYVGEIDGRTGLVAKNYIRILPNELARLDKSPRTMSQTGNKSPRPGAPVGAGAAPMAAAPPLARAVSQSGGIGALAPQPAVKVVARPAQAPVPLVAPFQPVAAKQPQTLVTPHPAAPQPTVFAGGKPYTAIADYVGARENVLSFAKGDVIMIVDQSRQDWWRGVLRGRTGAVPATYVRTADAIGASAAGSVSSASLAKEDDSADRRGRRSTIVAAPDVAAKMRAAAEQQKKSKLGTALYAFQQQKPGVLIFKKGDVLTILDDSRIDWWKAELNGKVIVFMMVLFFFFR